MGVERLGLLFDSPVCELTVWGYIGLLQGSYSASLRP